MSFFCRNFLGAILVLGAGVANAQAPVLRSAPVTASPVVAQVAPAPKAPAETRLGVMADAGVPDGLMVSLVARPVRWLRLHAGAGSNSISPGFRGGLTWLPFGSGISLSAEAGRYLEGDANGMIRSFGAETSEYAPLLERIGYDFANVHLGLDFGRRRATFFVHAGMGYVRTKVHNVNDVLNDDAGAGAESDGESTKVSVNGDPIIRALMPTVKLGLIVYLW